MLVLMNFLRSILERSVSVSAVPELIVGVAVGFFDKASSPFCITVSRQC